MREPAVLLEVEHRRQVVRAGVSEVDEPVGLRDCTRRDPSVADASRPRKVIGTERQADAACPAAIEDIRRIGQRRALRRLGEDE